jgi:hypothetical protein
MMPHVFRGGASRLQIIFRFDIRLLPFGSLIYGVFVRRNASFLRYLAPVDLSSGSLRCDEL